MIDPKAWAARAQAMIAPPPQTTQIGYAITCDRCGADVMEIQTAHALQGIGEAGTFRNTYHREPHHCP